MKNHAQITYLFLLSFFSIGTVQSQTVWKADAANSYIGFEVSHMTISTVSGRFTDFTCEISAKKKSLEDAKVKVSIAVNSVSTENLTRDEHLKKDDFFNVEKYPQMLFESESFVKNSETEYEITGTLTIRDVAKKVKFMAMYNGTVKSGTRTVSAFSASFMINRFDYQLKWDNTLDSGGLVVGEEVKIILHLELVKS